MKKLWRKIRGLFISRKEKELVKKLPLIIHTQSGKPLTLEQYKELAEFMRDK